MTVQLHLYPPERMLMPRGSLKKESISVDIVERLMVSYEYWTDKKYGDSLSKNEVCNRLIINLHAEVDAAWREFIAKVYPEDK